MWSCSTCTLQNPAQRRRCEACGDRRPVAVVVDGMIGSSSAAKDTTTLVDDDSHQQEEQQQQHHRQESCLDANAASDTVTADASSEQVLFAAPTTSNNNNSSSISCNAQQNAPRTTKKRSSVVAGWLQHQRQQRRHQKRNPHREAHAPLTALFGQRSVIVRLTTGSCVCVDAPPPPPPEKSSQPASLCASTVFSSSSSSSETPSLCASNICPADTNNEGSQQQSPVVEHSSLAVLLLPSAVKEREKIEPTALSPHQCAARVVDIAHEKMSGNGGRGNDDANHQSVEHCGSAATDDPPPTNIEPSIEVVACTTNNSAIELEPNHPRGGCAIQDGEEMMTPHHILTSHTRGETVNDSFSGTKSSPAVVAEHDDCASWSTTITKSNPDLSSRAPKVVVDTDHGKISRDTELLSPTARKASAIAELSPRGGNDGSRCCSNSNSNRLAAAIFAVQTDAATCEAPPASSSSHGRIGALVRRDPTAIMAESSSRREPEPDGAAATTELSPESTFGTEALPSPARGFASFSLVSAKESFPAPLEPSFILVGGQQQQAILELLVSPIDLAPAKIPSPPRVYESQKNYEPQDMNTLAKKDLATPLPLASDNIPPVDRCAITIDAAMSQTESRQRSEHDDVGANQPQLVAAHPLHDKGEGGACGVKNHDDESGHDDKASPALIPIRLSGQIDEEMLGAVEEETAESGHSDTEWGERHSLSVGSAKMDQACMSVNGAAGDNAIDERDDSGDNWTSGSKCLTPHCAMGKSRNNDPIALSKVQVDEGRGCDFFYTPTTTQSQETQTQLSQGADPTSTSPLVAKEKALLNVPSSIPAGGDVQRTSPLLKPMQYMFGETNVSAIPLNFVNGGEPSRPDRSAPSKKRPLPETFIEDCRRGFDGRVCAGSGGSASEGSDVRVSKENDCGGDSTSKLPPAMFQTAGLGSRITISAASLAIAERLLSDGGGESKTESRLPRARCITTVDEAAKTKSASTEMISRCRPVTTQNPVVAFQTAGHGAALTVSDEIIAKVDAILQSSHVMKSVVSQMKHATAAFASNDNPGGDSTPKLPAIAFHSAGFGINISASSAGLARAAQIFDSQIRHPHREAHQDPLEAGRFDQPFATTQSTRVAQSGSVSVTGFSLLEPRTSDSVAFRRTAGIGATEALSVDGMAVADKIHAADSTDGVMRQANLATSNTSDDELGDDSTSKRPAIVVRSAELASKVSVSAGSLVRADRIIPVNINDDASREVLWGPPRICDVASGKEAFAPAIPARVTHSSFAIASGSSELLPPMNAITAFRTVGRGATLSASADNIVVDDTVRNSHVTECVERLAMQTKQASGACAQNVHFGRDSTTKLPPAVFHSAGLCSKISVSAAGLARADSILGCRSSKGSSGPAATTCHTTSSIVTPATYVAQGISSARPGLLPPLTNPIIGCRAVGRVAPASLSVCSVAKTEATRPNTRYLECVDAHHVLQDSSREASLGLLGALDSGSANANDASSDLGHCSFAIASGPFEPIPSADPLHAFRTAGSGTRVSVNADSLAKAEVILQNARHLENVDCPRVVQAQVAATEEASVRIDFSRESFNVGQSLNAFQTAGLGSKISVSALSLARAESVLAFRNGEVSPHEPSLGLPRMLDGGSANTDEAVAPAQPAARFGYSGLAIASGTADLLLPVDPTVERGIAGQVAAFHVSDDIIADAEAIIRSGHEWGSADSPAGQARPVSAASISSGGAFTSKLPPVAFHSAGLNSKISVSAGSLARADSILANLGRDESKQDTLFGLPRMFDGGSSNESLTPTTNARVRRGSHAIVSASDEVLPPTDPLVAFRSAGQGATLLVSTDSLAGAEVILQRGNDIEILDAGIATVDAFSSLNYGGDGLPSGRSLVAFQAAGLCGTILESAAAAPFAKADGIHANGKGSLNEGLASPSALCGQHLATARAISGCSAGSSFAMFHTAGSGSRLSVSSSSLATAERILGVDGIGVEKTDILEAVMGSSRSMHPKKHYRCETDMISGGKLPDSDAPDYIDPSVQTTAVTDGGFASSPTKGIEVLPEESNNRFSLSTAKLATDDTHGERTQCVANENEISPQCNPAPRVSFGFSAENEYRDPSPAEQDFQNESLVFGAASPVPLCFDVAPISITDAEPADSAYRRQAFKIAETPVTENHPAEQVSFRPFVTPGTAICRRSNGFGQNASPPISDGEPDTDSSLDALVDVPEFRRNDDESCSWDEQAYRMTKGRLDCANDNSEAGSNSCDDKMLDDGYPRTLCDAVSNGFMIAKHSDCLRFGVSFITLNVNSENACRVRFDPVSLLPISICETDYPTHPMAFGSLSDFKAALVELGCDDGLICEKWVSTHVRWIVWKLASTERRFAPYLGGKYLTFNTVARHLFHRYEKEVRGGARPAVRKLLNRDVSANCMLILCVARMKLQSPSDDAKRDDTNAMNPEYDRYILELTDGWYSMPAAPDARLCEFIADGTIRIGTKLLVSNSAMTGYDDGIDPLDRSFDPFTPGSSPVLHIVSNSTRLARWNAKLGFVRPSHRLLSQEGMLLVSRISDVIDGGGRIPLIDLRVTRRYPIMYLDRQSNPHGGKARLLTESEESARLEAQEKQRQRIIDKFSEEIEAECIKVRFLFVWKRKPHLQLANLFTAPKGRR